MYCQGQLFCFDAFLSAGRADQTDVDGQTGKLAYMAEHTHRAARAQAQGKATNFLISIIATGHKSVLFNKSVVEIRTACALVPGGHYYE